MTTSALASVSYWNVAERREDPEYRLQEEILSLMRAECREGGRGTPAKLARKLRTTPPHISNLIAEPPLRRPGKDIMRAYAAHRGTSLEKLAASIGVYLPADPAAPLKLAEPVLSYRNLEALLDKKPDAYTHGDIKAAKAMPFKGNNEPTEDEWDGILAKIRAERRGKTADAGGQTDDDHDPAAWAKPRPRKK